MTTLSPTCFSAQWAYSDRYTRLYAPALAGAMGWPTPVYTVNATDQTSIDTLYGGVGVDWKVRRSLYGKPPDDPDLALVDRLRFHVGAADWAAHIWPSEAPGTVVLVHQRAAASWLRTNHEALERLRHVSSEGTTFFTPSFSLLEATLPRDRVLKVTVTRSSL